VLFLVTTGGWMTAWVCEKHLGNTLFANSHQLKKNFSTFISRYFHHFYRKNILSIFKNQFYFILWSVIFKFILNLHMIKFLLVYSSVGSDKFIK
jgi:hypothetical protein